MIDRVVDIAGVPVRFRATDAERGALLTAKLRGFADTDAPPVASLCIDAERAEPPTRTPDDELFTIRFWAIDDGMVVATDDFLLRAEGEHATAHLPDVRAGDPIDGFSGLALTWLLAPHARFVLHGAAVARGQQGIVLLGHTGAGKSTAAAAALEAGWRVLADDEIVIDASQDGLRVHGFHRAPAVPLEIGGPVADSGTALGDPRARAELPRDVLAPGAAAVTAVVVLAHHDGDGALVSSAASSVLPLLLQSFGATVDPRRRAMFFPVAAQLARLPTWELAHARDARSRRARAVEMLDEVLTRVEARDVSRDA